MLTQKALVAQGTGVIIPAIAGRPIYVKKLIFSGTTAGTVQFQDTNSNNLTGAMTIAVGSPFIMQEPNESSSQDGWLITAPGVGIQVVVSRSEERRVGKE